MGFINPFVNSDDEDGDIFETEISFSGVFNTFVNQCCVTKLKFHLFPILVFRFYALPKILEMLETYVHKKLYFQDIRETKMSPKLQN